MLNFFKFTKQKQKYLYYLEKKNHLEYLKMKSSA